MVSSTACFEMKDVHSSSLALLQEDQGLCLPWFVAASADSRSNATCETTQDWSTIVVQICLSKPCDAYAASQSFKETLRNSLTAQAVEGPSFLLSLPQSCL